MKKLTLLLLILLIQTACETGTKYDKNVTNTTVEDSGIADMVNDLENEVDNDPTNSNSYYVDQGEDDYAQELSISDSQPEEVEPSKIPKEEIIEQTKQHFTGGTLTDGLEIKKIRVANHDTYIRLVLDSDVIEGGSSSSSDKVGHYEVDYDPNTEVITVVLSGYRKFSANFPTFSKNSTIEKIYFSKYLDDSGYKLNIKLRQSAKIAVFALETPARLVFDIKAI